MERAALVCRVEGSPDHPLQLQGFIELHQRDTDEAYRSVFTRSLSSYIHEFIPQQYHPAMSDFRVGLLAKVVRGVKCCNGSYPQDLSAETIFLSEDGKFLAITGWGETYVDCRRRLGELFRLVLRNNDELANDIIHGLVRFEIHMNDILAHPLFWTVEQKISFICEVYEWIVSKRLQDDVDIYAPRVFHGGWKQQLLVAGEELRDVRKYARTHAIRTVNDKAVQRRADSYTDSLHELLRFFRNFKVHYFGNNRAMMACFQGYPEGYWRFFFRRYPRLLLWVRTYARSSNFFNNYGDP